MPDMDIGLRLRKTLYFAPKKARQFSWINNVIVEMGRLSPSKP
jgi:hypothetical protein